MGRGPARRRSTSSTARAPPSRSIASATGPVVAFCGIGNPEGFRRTLAGLGAEVVDFRAFPDHHPYDRRDVDDLIGWARDRGASLALTTQKDSVKLRLAALGPGPAPGRPDRPGGHERPATARRGPRTGLAAGPLIGSTDRADAFGKGCPMRIVVFCPNLVGDTVMATPTLRALRRGFPEAHIAGVIKPAVAPTLDGNPWLDDLIRFHPKSADPRRADGRRDRPAPRERFDLAVLLPNSIRSALMATARRDPAAGRLRRGGPRRPC